MSLHVDRVAFPGQKLDLPSSGAMLDAHAIISTLDVKNATASHLLSGFINSVDQVGICARGATDRNKAGCAVFFSDRALLNSSLIGKHVRR